MKKGAIQLIIGLMSVALLGIAIIQFYYIKHTVDESEERFNADVLDALNRVHNRLLKEAKINESSLQNLKESLRKKSKLQLIPESDPINSLLSPNYKEWQIKKYTSELQDLFIINPQYLFENIEPKTLNTFLEQEFYNEGIGLAYEYGVYNNTSNSWFIVNSAYVAEFGDTAEASIGADLGDEYPNLSNTPHEIKIFGTEDRPPPGALKIFFPSKTRFLWSSVWTILLPSIIFTSLILFCFIYSINVIFRQKQVSMMKTDFINNMTHEFKTPIATISLAADSITSPKVSESKEKVARFAGIIKQENKRMLSQVEKVLQMAMMDKKNFQLNLTQVNIHDVITQAVEHANLKVSSKQGKVTSTLNASHQNIEGDKLHVSNVIHNLLDNANKYTTKAPDIKVITEDTKKGVRVTIQDNGIGMNKDALKHIFDKFYRVHTGNLHDVKGFGLGLSYVKAIIDAHKGTIDVKSEVGVGSKFILTFPLKVVTN